MATLSELESVGTDEAGCPRVLARELLGERIVVARLGSEVVAMHGTCPHRGADLALGWVSEASDAIVCRYHGFEWGANGRIVRVPALEAAGKSLPAGKSWCAATYPTIVRYGLIWVCLGAEPRLPLVDVFEAGDPAYRPLHQRPDAWRATCGRIVEASLDTYHFAFTHRGTIGDPSVPGAPVAATLDIDGAYAIEYELAQPAVTDVTYLSSDAPGTVRSRYRFVAQPSVVYMVKSTGTVTFATLLAMHPRNAGETVIYRTIFLARDGKFDADAFQRTQNAVFREDKVVVESQRPSEVSSDLDAELHALMDRPTVGYRRWLASLGVSAS